MCDEELELEGVRRWFYGGEPPPGEDDPLLQREALAFAAAALAVAGARGPAGAWRGWKVQPAGKDKDPAAASS